MLYILLIVIIFIIIPNILILSNRISIENFYLIRYKLIWVSDKLASQDGLKERYYTYRLRSLLLPYMSDTVTLSQSMVCELGINKSIYNNWYGLSEAQRKLLKEALGKVRGTILN